MGAVGRDGRARSWGISGAHFSGDDTNISARGPVTVGLECRLRRIPAASRSAGQPHRLGTPSALDTRGLVSVAMFGAVARPAPIGPACPT